MQLIVDQSLATGFIPINTQQQRASLSFKPGVLERKVYNNDNITFFSVITFSKPSCDNVLQCSQVRAATHYHTRAGQRLIHGRMFYPLSKDMKKYQPVIYIYIYIYIWSVLLLSFEYKAF